MKASLMELVTDASVVSCSFKALSKFLQHYLILVSFTI